MRDLLSSLQPFFFSLPFALILHSCISPDHRGRRLVPPILGSLYTQVLPHKIKQAVFSTAVPLPMCPVSLALHWGRPVNPELCVQAGYIQTQKVHSPSESIDLCLFFSCSSSCSSVSRYYFFGMSYPFDGITFLSLRRTIATKS